MYNNYNKINKRLISATSIPTIICNTNAFPSDSQKHFFLECQANIPCKTYIPPH